MTTIFPHTTDENLSDYNLIPVGNILLGFGSRNITTKTYKNTVLVVGNSKRKLKDLIQYYSYSDGAILRFYKGQLTTTVPEIYITDINGVNINGSGDYLGVNSAGNIININRKEYQVKELSDVAIDVPPNKYALTYNGSIWRYEPEASALSKFDDVVYAKIPYGVFVSYFADPNVGGFGNTYHVLPLTIRWDRLPTLASNLNCNGNTINNAFYYTQTVNASSPITSIPIDTIIYSETNVVCGENVKVLSLDIMVNQNHLKFFTLNLINFVGIVNFKSQADILLENGYLPEITKPNNTYSLVIYKDDVKLKIVITHKNRNMASYGN